MKLFFVSGGARSGVALLGDILHTDAAAARVEGGVAPFQAILDAYRRTKQDVATGASDFFTDADDLLRFYRPVAAALVERAILRHPGASVVLVDTGFADLLPDIAALLSQARFLVAVRDPRDAVASMIGRKRKPRGNGQSSEVETAARHLHAAYQPALTEAADGFRSRRLLVKYEHVIGDPARAFARLRAFTEFEFAALAPDDAPPEGGWAARAFSGRYSRNTIGHHDTMLTRAEIGLVESICRPIFDAAGYRRSVGAG